MKPMIKNCRNCKHDFDLMCGRFYKSFESEGEKTYECPDCYDKAGQCKNGFHVRSSHMKYPGLCPWCKETLKPFILTTNVSYE
jgi:hypothetical protein